MAYRGYILVPPLIASHPVVRKFRFTISHVVFCGEIRGPPAKLHFNSLDIAFLQE
jgi:hypothetical protein